MNQTHDLDRLRRWLPAVEKIAWAAGRVILSFAAGAVAARNKADGSPVTAADEAAEAEIMRGLAALAPEIPIVAEEAMAAGGGPPVGGNSFWLVDPLDGTREFIAGRDEYAVNIALIDNACPVLGVVHGPGQGVTYSGIGGAGAWRRMKTGTREEIHARATPSSGAIVLASRSHGDEAALQALLAGVRITEIRRSGSALKFGALAAGEADLYPRLGRTMEWDTAAGHAVVKASGGEVATLSGEALRYGKADFANPFFVATGTDKWPG